MRLLIVSSEFPPGPGGIGTHSHQVALQLSLLGWDVSVVSPQDFVQNEAEIAAFNRAQPFELVRFQSGTGWVSRGLNRWLASRMELERRRPDILLASGDRSIYLGARLARRFRLPWVAMEHGSLPGSLLERWVKRRSLALADAVVCVSRYTQEAMFRMSVSPRRCYVIPNGADTTRFRVLPERLAGEGGEAVLPRCARVLVTVGSVTRRKGQDVVIRALPRVLKRVPNTHYVSVGFPLLRREYDRVAAEHGVGAHVHFLGALDGESLVSWLNRAEVFVLTSRHTETEFEGYGIAAVEAALCGKPAVVSGDCGLEEAVVDGQTGIVVPPDDAPATAAAILSLLENEGLRRRMGEAARRRALQEQSWEGRGREYSEMLQDVLKERASARAASSSEESGPEWPGVDGRRRREVPEHE
jgi:phosphatidylinositol alpha-1,6-mannosyltransferase